MASDTITGEKVVTVDLSALRKRRGRLGVQYLPLSDELTVGVTVASLETLIAQGRLPNPLLEAALNLGKRIRDDAGNVDPSAFIESVEFMDALCSAIVKDPPWCPINEAGDGAVPDGKLCLADLNEEERGAIFRLVYGGMESYESFREERQRAAAAPDGGELREDAEQLPDADSTESPEVLVRPSRVAKVAKGGKGAGGSSDGAEASDAA